MTNYIFTLRYTQVDVLLPVAEVSHGKCKTKAGHCAYTTHPSDWSMDVPKTGGLDCSRGWRCSRVVVVTLWSLCEAQLREEMPPLHRTQRFSESICLVRFELAWLVASLMGRLIVLKNGKRFHLGKANLGKQASEPRGFAKSLGESRILGFC
jgi:hypothetical protein